MSRAPVMIDIDNVLCCTDAVLRRLIKAYTDGRVSLDYDDIRKFNYWENDSKHGSRLTRAEWGAVHRLFGESELDGLEVLEGAKKAVAALSLEFDIEFVTSRGELGREATERWLGRHGFSGHLRFAEHGKKHLNGRPYVAAIEDDRDQALLFLDRGVRSYLLAHPWNDGARVASLIRLSSWELIAHDLLKT
jgi:hypothetical protein